MNKYIKSDIKDGLNSIRIGLGNLMYSMIKENIKVYDLDISMDIFIIPSILRDFDSTIKLKEINTEYVEFKVKKRTIRIVQFKDHCVFFNN